MRQCIITITSSSGHHDRVIFSLVADTVFQRLPRQRLMSWSGPSSKPLEVFLTPTPPSHKAGPRVCLHSCAMAHRDNGRRSPTQRQGSQMQFLRQLHARSNCRGGRLICTACPFQYSSKSFQTTEKSIPCARPVPPASTHASHVRGPALKSRERARAERDVATGHQPPAEREPGTHDADNTCRGDSIAFDEEGDQNQDLQSVVTSRVHSPRPRRPCMPSDLMIPWMASV